MFVAKRTKRVRTEAEGQTLDALIAERRAKLVELREETPSLRAQARELIARADGMTARWQRRMALNSRRVARELVVEADARDSMEREHAFERDVVGYLRAYHMTTPSVPIGASCAAAVKSYVDEVDEATQRRAAVADEYLVQARAAPPKVVMALRDECPRCDTELVLCASKSIMTCPKCGHAVTYLDATTSSTAFDEVVEFTQYSYKRVNHYSAWLALVQGKEAHRVPDAILDVVMQDLRERQRVLTPEEVTPPRVRESLRRLKLIKAYDHVAQIAARISGVQPPRISPQVEARLKTMFLQMQPAFQRNAPRSRTNFLSYGYVLYRSFQIMGLPHMLPGLTLLKGRDKLEANDAIFRAMCIDLGWPVFELPPAEEDEPDDGAMVAAAEPDDGEMVAAAEPDDGAMHENTTAAV